MPSALRKRERDSVGGGSFALVGDKVGGALWRGSGSVLALRRVPVEHEHFRAWTGVPVLGAPSCAALTVQKLFEDAIVFAYAGG